MSSPSPLHRLATQHFDERYKHKQSESFLSQPEHTIWVSKHRTLRTQYLHLGVFLRKQYIIIANCKVFVYVLLYYFTFQTPTYWNCRLHKCFLPDEVFFPFLEQVLLIFHLLFSFHVKFKQGIQRHENILNSTFETIDQGTKVRIWICSEYNVVFNSSCIALCNLTTSVTFSFTSFLS